MRQVAWILGLLAGAALSAPAGPVGAQESSAAFGDVSPEAEEPPAPTPEPEAVPPVADVPYTAPAADSLPPSPADSDDEAASPDLIGRELRPYVRPPYQETKEPRRLRMLLFPRRRYTFYRHDGFYLRMAAGIGVGTDRLHGSWSDYGFEKDSGRLGRMVGAAVATEAALGGSVVPGLVMGVGTFTSVWPAPAETEYDFNISQLALFAPMIDVYPKPRKGWHVQAAVGVASFTMGFGTTGSASPRPAQAHVAAGAGFLLGAGHEWWIAEQWSLGILLRMMRAWSRGDDSDGGSWAHRSQSYSALVTCTWH